MKTEDIISQLEKLAPLSLQEDWDNSGLQIKSHNNKIKNILLTLDITNDSVNFAKKNNCNLIISHHPIFFNPIKNLSIDNPIENLVVNIIKNEINIISFHTNIDSAEKGLADFFAKKIGLINLTPLIEKSFQNYKIITFVPEEFLDSFLNLLLKNNLSVIDSYKACSFYSKGIGSFYPDITSSPHIGEVEKLNKVNEYRIEISSSEKALRKTLTLLRKFHPYEVPVIDIYPLKKVIEAKDGFGRLGTLSKEMTLKELIHLLKKSFNIDFVKITENNLEKKVKNIAICPGSGGSLIKNAIKKGAEVYITGDVKYHEALEAKQFGLTIIDMGHFETEIIFIELLKNFLEKNINIPIITFEQKKLFKGE